MENKDLLFYKMNAAHDLSTLAGITFTNAHKSSVLRFESYSDLYRQKKEYPNTREI